MEGNDYEIYRELGKAFSYLKCDEFAHHFYSKAIEINPSSYSTHYSFAMHLTQTKQWDGALQHFDHCIESKENESDLRKGVFTGKYASALDHCNVDRDEEAEKYYKMTIENEEKRRNKDPVWLGRARRSYAQFLMKKEKYMEALEEYEKSLICEPRNEWCYWKMAKCHFILGNKEKNGECLKCALEINPEHRGAKQDHLRHFGYEYDQQQNDDDDDDEYKQVNDESEWKQNEIITNLDQTFSNELRSLDLAQHTKQNEATNGYQHTTNSAPTYDQSAQSTALSAYHPCNDNEREFIRIYKNEFKNDKDWGYFNKHLMEMQLKGLNDMRTVIKHNLNTLRDHIQSECKIKNKEHLEKMMDLFGKIKEKHLLFQTALEVNGIDEMSINKIESNGIFCLADLQKSVETLADVFVLLNVKSDDDMEKISSNNKNATRGDEDDINNAERIYNLIQMLDDN